MTDTDWIARFRKGRDENASPTDRECILRGCAAFNPEHDPAVTARWVASGIEHMEERLDRPACERVMFT